MCYRIKILIGKEHCIYVVWLGYEQLLPIDCWIYHQIWFWYLPIITFTLLGESYFQSKAEKELCHQSVVTYDTFLSMCDKGQMLPIIDGFAIDCSKWLEVHPGGRRVIERNSKHS
eukprot:UN22557